MKSITSILIIALVLKNCDSRRSTRNQDTPNRTNGNWNGEFQYLARANAGGVYDSYCNEKLNLTCDTKALLHCHRNRCTCLHNEDMIFDAVKGQCVVKAGGKCIYGREEPNPELRLKNLECVLNGYCNREEGICECSSRYYNSLNVTCVQQKAFDHACHFDSECREDYHLHCINGFCKCDPSVSIKHRKYEICLGLAGEKAIDGNCIDFSEPISFSPLIPTRCQCNEGYVRGEDKKCHGTLNQACTVGSLCKASLSCVEGTCKCPFHNYQVYDTIQDKCLSDAYGPCNASSDCVPTAFCNITGLYNQCECKPGYIVGSSRHCEKSLGTKCQIIPHATLPNPASPVTPEVVDECSTSALLHCRDGRCSCTELKTFSREQGKCVGLVGSICFSTDDAPICIENAKCVYTSRLGFGLCKCNPSSRVTPDRKCELIPIVATTTQEPIRTDPTVVERYCEGDGAVEKVGRNAKALGSDSSFSTNNARGFIRARQIHARYWSRMMSH